MSEEIIFLAHASEDKPFARSLYKKLKQEGLFPWLDEENLSPGVEWDDEIKRVIKKSKYFVALISKNSVGKDGYVQRELRLALSELERKAPGTRYFIPALIHDIPLPEINVGTISLNSYQAARLYEDDGVEKLIDTLREKKK